MAIDFETWLRDGGRREQTIPVYVRSVRQFTEWLEGSRGRVWNPDEVSPQAIHDWINYMQTVEKVAKATINKWVASLKIYWC